MTLATVLLAGGESRRMGRDKATLIFQGKPLWQHQLETLRRLNPTEILISAREDPAWRPNDIEFIADEPPSRGPSSGIAAVLSKIESTHLLVLAIDLPFMTDQCLNSLVEYCAKGQGAVPKIADRFEPLAAIYPREATIDLEATLRGEDFSLQTVIARLVSAGKVVAMNVPANQRGLFRNLNEPADIPLRNR